MKSLPHLGAAVLLAAPAGAWALGLGDIELQSALNQPFRAEIPLVSATADELESLRVGLASPETFARYGLDSSSELSSLEFEIGKNSRGQNVIRIHSERRIDEPFLTMLVEATWPRGRMLREYTVLLDPPSLLPGLGEEPPVRQAATAPSRSPSASGAIARAPAPQTASAGASAPSAPAAGAGGASSATRAASGSRSPASSGSVAAAQPSGSAARSVQPGGTYGPVERNETLWSIASSLRPAGVTTNQMMVALYEANPEAFSSNMNLLRRGASLRVPDLERLRAASPEAATAEVREQDEAWQGRGEVEPRLRLVPPTQEVAAAGAAGAGSAAAAPSSSEGGSASASASAAEDAEEVSALREQVESLQGQLDESRRLLELRDSQLQALQSQAAGATAPAAQPPAAAADAASAAAPGVDLESQQVFADGADSASDAANAAAPGADSASSNSAASEQAAAATSPPAAEPKKAAPVTPAPTKASAPAPAVKPPPSLLSKVVGWVANPVLLIGLGIGAVLLTAVWYLRHRREDEDQDVTGRWDALEAEIEEEARTQAGRLKPQDSSMIVEEQTRRPRVSAGDGASAAAASTALARDADETLSTQTVINLDQADPVAEADFHMAYGLYDQAADLVSKALETDPDRRDLKLKLLEVYFVWGNKEAFLDAARGLHAEIGDAGDADWDKVLIMGKQICPDEPMFAEAAGAGAVDVDLQGDGSTELDFAFDEKDAAEVFDFGDASPDFQLAETGERFGSSERDDEEPDDEERDEDKFGSLDIGAQTAAGLEAALFMGDEEEDGAAADAAADTGRATKPNIDIDALAVTQESPTVESAGRSDDWAALLDDVSESEERDGDGFDAAGPDSPTVETPTVESLRADAPTVETPTLETAYHADSPTVETPTIETAYASRTSRVSKIERPAAAGASSDHTEEIDLDDLGLSLGDLEDLPEDIGELPRADDGESDTREQPALRGDDELLSATGVTEVLHEEDLEQMETSVLSGRDATVAARILEEEDDVYSGTEVIEERLEADGSGDTSLVRALSGYAGDDGLDLNLEDFSAALEGGDTVEQPRTSSSLHADIFGGGSTPIDLDVGADIVGPDDPTGTEQGPLDAQTMTEIGTKLDLARAYIDMGDPDGARSILEEVLDEGDAGQRREAQGLIDALTA
ncbi:MAG TPA: FimV/HubP family polar landmark protein [Gammaproteobacteria bacterium]|nr:FimV/HubP family polar landmark protein [Gammaproteobacteria bacterium]